MDERLTLSFRLRGYPGRALVTVGPNEDPIRTGHALVAVGFDADRFRGFPVALAIVEYEGFGINASMGWLQVVRHFEGDRQTSFAVDGFPLAPETPLYTYGYAPTFFDAPANPDHNDYIWRADTWLIAIPDVIRSRTIAPIVGFTWGYELTSGRPRALPLRSVVEEDWLQILARLRQVHPAWEFAQGFGVGADTFVGAVAEQAVQRIKQRRRLMAHERSIRNSQPERARHIRRRNLTDTASRATSDRERGRLREQIGCALNTLFRVRPDVAALYVEELNFASRRMSKQVHRRLNRWLKGYMQRQLITKAKLNGVELNVVNAAYTSQTCPSCWYTSSRNRSADRFECSQCGFNGSADAVAATNVLRRGSDLAITRFTPATRVKQILDERWHSARLGRAWGSNEGDSAERWTGVGASDRHEPRTTVKLALRESDGPFTRMFSSCGDGLRAGVSADPGGVDIRHC